MHPAPTTGADRFRRREREEYGQICTWESLEGKDCSDELPNALTDDGVRQGVRIGMHGCDGDEFKGRKMLNAAKRGGMSAEGETGPAYSMQFFHAELL